MKTRLAVLAAVAVLAFGACSSTPTTTQPPASAAASAGTSAAASAPASAAASGGAADSISLTRFGSFTPEFHPIYAEANQYLTYYLIFDTLVGVDLSDKTMLTNVPDLATSWTASPDGSQYTFKLATGVTWHDGKPFDANDVAFTGQLDGREPLVIRHRLRAALVLPEGCRGRAGRMRQGPDRREGVRRRHR